MKNDAELIRLRAEVERMQALLRAGCDLLSVEADSLKEGISVGGVMCPTTEDKHTVLAIAEIEDWIGSVKATICPAALEAAAIAAWNRRSDLCASGQQVRALVWEHRAITIDNWHSEVLVHGQRLYAITDWRNGSVELNIEGIEGVEIGSFPTLEAAKAAAQANYERRTLSALTPAPDAFDVRETASEAHQASLTSADAQQSPEARRRPAGF